MNVVRFCSVCGRQIRPEWGDADALCLRCVADRADAEPADPGNRVTLWFALIVLGVSLLGLLGYYAVVSILAGAGD